MIRSLPDAVQLRVTAVLHSLTAEQLTDLAAGRAQLVYRPCPERPRRAGGREPRTDDHTDVVAVIVEAINELSTPAEVEDYLRRDAADLPLPVLKQVARALGPTVASTGRNKEQVRRDIVAGTVGFRTRSAAMSGGAWA